MLILMDLGRCVYFLYSPLLKKDYLLTTYTISIKTIEPSDFDSQRYDRLKNNSKRFAIFCHPEKQFASIRRSLEEISR